MKGLLLISGGIDSPVAGWLIKQRGIELDAVNFAKGDVDKDSIVFRLLKKIGINKCYVVPHAEFMEKLTMTNPRYTCIICKRTMLRIAEKIAQKQGFDFIATGENLGQVASQTLDNMAVVSNAVKMNIIRPVLCNDKVEIMDIARKIGTYEISAENSSAKCPFLPHHPATTSSIEQIEKEEAKVQLNELIEAMAERAKTIEL
jgi:thiamine biosynthesis protein ThiI